MATLALHIRTCMKVHDQLQSNDRKCMHASAYHDRSGLLYLLLLVPCSHCSHGERRNTSWPDHPESSVTPEGLVSFWSQAACTNKVGTPAVVRLVTAGQCSTCRSNRCQYSISCGLATSICHANDSTPASCSRRMTRYVGTAMSDLVRHRKG